MLVAEGVAVVAAVMAVVGAAVVAVVVVVVVGIAALSWKNCGLPSSCSSPLPGWGRPHVFVPCHSFHLLVRDEMCVCNFSVLEAPTKLPVDLVITPQPLPRMSEVCADAVGRSDG